MSWIAIFYILDEEINFLTHFSINFKMVSLGYCIIKNTIWSENGILAAGHPLIFSFITVRTQFVYWVLSITFESRTSKPLFKYLWAFKPYRMLRVCFPFGRVVVVNHKILSKDTNHIKCLELSVWHWKVWFQYIYYYVIIVTLCSQQRLLYNTLYSIAICVTIIYTLLNAFYIIIWAYFI